MTDVISLGELFIDFVAIESGVSLLEASTFKRNPGGAPLHVAVGLAHLGISCGLVGQVGDDVFGQYLERMLWENGVETSALRFSDRACTTLAFTSPGVGNQDDSAFCYHPGADTLLEPDEIDAELIRTAQIFHFGSGSLANEPACSATLKGVKIAREAGLLISYAPSLRLALWPDPAIAREGMLTGWLYAHVIKVNKKELLFLAQEDNPDMAAHKLWHHDLRLLVVTNGAAGCVYYTQTHRGRMPGFAVEAVDACGAGDGFVAGLLARLVQDKHLFEDVERVEQALRYANAVGALTTTQHGVLSALPTPERVDSLLKTGRMPHAHSGSPG
jgi:fructokinase